MSLTYSPAPAIGSACPDFRLPSVDEKIFSLSDFSTAKLLAVAFICNHCPYVKAIEDRLIGLAKEYKPKDVTFVGICSNDPTDYPEDEPAELFHRWKAKNYQFPYLIDAPQDVARRFGAVCTPEFFLFDQERRLSYRGRLDDSWRNAALVKKRELKAAIDTLLAGKLPGPEQIPSMGCSIKWKTEGK